MRSGLPADKPANGGRLRPRFHAHEHDGKQMIQDPPSAVADSLQSLCIEERRPAYLVIGADAVLAGSGGDLAHYGADNLSPSLPVVEQLDYLAGILPLDGESLILPCLQTAPDVYADLHCFPSEDGDCVVLLDATPMALQRQALQQNTNELLLLRRRQDALLSEIRQNRDNLISILNQLDLVTMIVAPDGTVDFLSESGHAGLGLSAESVLGRPWHAALPLADEDCAAVRTMISTPAHARERIPVQIETGKGRRFYLEIDIQDDPRQEGQTILYMYDVSEIYTLRRQLDRSYSFEDMIGQSAPMQRVFDMIRDVARVDATVLVHGETGTGKELAARAIHAMSPRKDKPFIVVNSAGLSDSLINSQLFGHKKGSFTDAVSDQPGFFEAAEGGTLLLDEIGDIPPNTQTRILRALEQKEIIRIGETKPRKIDVRILAATNKDLDREVEEGRFRLDLLYRIRIARITLPALRDRAGDIPVLVRNFIEESRAMTGKDVADIDQDAMQALMDYRWPGNIRELRNAISFATIHCKGTSIRTRDLPPEIREELAQGGQKRRAFEVEDERERLMEALDMAGGRRGEAARLLGIGRATLYRRMKECMIDPADLPKQSRWNEASTRE